MRALITTRKNIEDENLKKRIFVTTGLISIYLLGTYVVIPGIDTTNLAGLLAQQTSSGLMVLLDMFSGGAFSNVSIFALGIIPYIYAFIIIQLVAIIIPPLRRMKREGESGCRKINQITRYLTVVILVLQGFAYLTNIQSQMARVGASVPTGLLFTISSIIIMAAGSMIVLWISERISDKGIGNGISLIIIIGILYRLSLPLAEGIISKINEQSGGLVLFITEVSLLLLIISISIILILLFRYIKQNVIIFLKKYNLLNNNTMK